MCCRKQLASYTSWCCPWLCSDQQSCNICVGMWLLTLQSLRLHALPEVTLMVIRGDSLEKGSDVSADRIR